ncbi:MAG: YidC/Oxa1 family membrane protein insertase [Candidatus Yanofskybacteria bacterium]|nr:YidC/Oxa1 family membrane protein insertase [Candidatus Yanofskybacteria bacterium]
MMELYNTILYQPLLNATVFLYNFIPGSDFGLAIITLTILIRVIMFPLTLKTAKSQRAMAKINPSLKAIKEKFKNDSQAQSAAIMNLYKENNVNPLSGCLPLIIQLPILIALYKAFGAGFKPESLDLLYGFIGNPGTINTISLGFLNIGSKNAVLAVLTGVFQFLQLRQNNATMAAVSSDGNKEMQAMNKQMLYFFPVMIIIIGWNLPAGLLLYWVTTTLFSMGEQVYIQRRHGD